MAKRKRTAIQTRTVYRTVEAKRRHKRPGMTIPLGVVAGFVPLGLFAYDGLVIGGPQNASSRVAMRLTGYDSSVHKWFFKELAMGWAPILGGIFAHKAANRLGINRAIAHAGIPLLRI